MNIRVGKPLVAASKIGDENVRAWRELQPLVEDEAVRTDLDRRVVRQGWRRLYRGYGDADRRFDDVLERLPEGDPLRADAMIGQERLRTSFGSLLKEYIPLAAKRDRYRTASMFDGSTPMEGAEQIDNVLKRRDQALEQAEAMLVVLEADLPTDQEEDATAQNSGAGGGGGEPQVFAEATSEDPVLPFPPLELDRVDTMMQWVGAGDEARELVGMLHLDYQDGCDTLATTYQAAMDVIEENEELGDWRAKRRARRDLRAQTSESLRLLEETLFSDIELSLADDAARDRLQQVRIAFEHARRRQAMARDDWSLRRQSEAMLDLSVLVLDQSAAELPLQQRSAVIEALVRSDRSAEGVLDELGTQIEAVQLLESRMYGREASELDPEVQERVRSNWQQRRAKVGELASSLATINRSGSDRIADAMGPVTGEAFREAYRKAAFPDLFEGEDEVNEAFQRAAAIATLTDQQRRQLQDLQIRHVTLFGQLTDELIRLRSDNDIQISSWPPNSDSMNLAMRNEQLRYRRGQVAARSMAELAVLLGPDQWELVSDLQEQSESRGRQRGQFR